MENLNSSQVLSRDEAKQRAYTLNIANGKTCSVTGGDAVTRYFKMKKGVLSEVPKLEYNYYQEQLARIKYNPNDAYSTSLKISQAVKDNNTNWLALNKESATDIVEWLTKNFID